MYECLQESVLKLLKLFLPGAKPESQLALAYRIFIQLIAQKKPGMYSEFLTGILDHQDVDRIRSNIRYTNTLLWLFAQMGAQDENSVIAITNMAKCIGESLLSQEKKKKFTEREVMTYCYNIVLYKDFFDKYVASTRAKEMWAQTMLLSVFTLDRIAKINLVSESAQELFQKANAAIIQLIYEADKLQTF